MGENTGNAVGKLILVGSNNGFLIIRLLPFFFLLGKSVEGRHIDISLVIT